MTGAAPVGPRRVFLTGHSGFVGSWLAVALLRAGATVTGFAATEDEQSRRRAAELARLGVTDLTGDIRDFPALRDAMAGGDFDTVVHLAAQPLVAVGLADPHGTLTTNIGGSINVLEAARLVAPRAVVHVTSDKCYRNRNWPWPYREVDELGGGCPYSVSKSGAELVFEAYAARYAAMPDGPRAASVRFGNVIGGGDRAGGRLVPDVVRAMTAGEPVRLRRPTAVRPWQHVLDVVEGLRLLVAGLLDGRVPAGDVLNFAPPGDGATVAELTAALTEAWRVETGAATRIVVEGAGDFPEEELLRLDGRKAAALLGWRHRLGLAESAAAVVAWHRMVGAGASAIEATAAQLRDFPADPVTAAGRTVTR